jgi:hypothetical protein
VQKQLKFGTIKRDKVTKKEKNIEDKQRGRGETLEQRYV